MEIVDPAGLEDIRRGGVLLRGDDGEYCLVYERWRFFYRLTGPAGPADARDGNGDAVPDYVEAVLCRLDWGYRLLRDLFGLAEPLKDDIRHIDIELDDIPFLYGVAFGSPRNDDRPLLVGTPHAGRSLKVKLHRGLGSQTATPMHEVFHLYQAGYARIANSWFMEGLATWYHNLFKAGVHRAEKLPATVTDFSALLVRKHDVSAFWLRLFDLCDSREAEIPPPYRDCPEIRQHRFPGRTFLRIMLQHLGRAFDAQSADGFAAMDPNERKLLPANNMLVFRAMLATIDALDPPPHEELAAFVAVLREQARDDLSLYDTPVVQDCLRSLAENQVCPVEECGGVLHTPYYDPLTGTLRAMNIVVAGAPPPWLRSVRRIEGNLTIEARDLTALDGPDSLESVSGGLTILDNPALTRISGFNGLTEVGSSLRIERNPRLKAVAGFGALWFVRQSLRIAKCPRLETVTGFGALRKIGLALDLADLPRLRDIGFCASLGAAKDVLISKCPIDSGAPLRQLFKTSPVIHGSIRITQTAIADVAFMAGLRSIASSFYLSQNRLTRLDGLERLQRVGASVSLSSNQLTDLTALRALTRIGGVLTLSNNDLATLAGLEALVELRPKPWNNSLSALRLYGNPRLTDIAALARVEAEGGRLILHVDDGQVFTRFPPKDSPFRRQSLDFRDRADAPLATGRVLAMADEDGPSDQLLAVWKETAQQVAEAAHRHGIDPSRLAAFQVREGSLAKAQGRLLARFFAAVDTVLPDRFGLACVTAQAPAASRHTPEYCERWFGQPKKDMFGSYFALPDPHHLLFIAVGTSNLHIGLVRCRRAPDGRHTVLPMAPDEAAALIAGRGADLPLARRGWGGGWCSIDCGRFDNPETAATYRAMTDFANSTLLNTVMRPLIERVT